MGEKIYIEDYTENSIIVYGPGTLKIKDELRKLGSWRPLKQRTSPKRAWIIPKSKESQVIKLIGSKGEKPKKSRTFSSTPKSKKPFVPISIYIDCVEETSTILGIDKDEVYRIVDKVYYPNKGKSPKLRTKAFKLPPKLYVYDKKKIKFTIPSNKERLSSLKWKKAKYAFRDIPGFLAADYDEMRVDSKTQTLIIPEGVVEFESVNNLVCEEGKPIKRISCPSTLEILHVIDNNLLESIEFPKKRNNLSMIDCPGSHNLKSLDLSLTKVIIINVSFCGSLKELILPSTGPKIINIMRTSLLALFVPPGVEKVECGTDVKLEKVYLKKNNQNRGDPGRPSKQEKMIAECIVEGVKKTEIYKRFAFRWVPTGKFNINVNFQNKFAWYETFPTPAEQRAVFNKINPPDISVFENLTPDIIEVILMKLPMNQLANFCKTSVKISSICRDKSFQRSYLSRNYGVKFGENPEYYGSNSYFKLYEAFDRGINWKDIKIGNEIKGKYIGPPGVKYDKDTQTLTMPKGTIGIKPNGAKMKTGLNVVEKMKFENPKDTKWIDPSDIQYVSILKDLMVLDLTRTTQPIIVMPEEEEDGLKELGIPYATDLTGWGSGPRPMIVRFSANKVWPNVK